MDKVYDHKKYEREIYKIWESSGAFKPFDFAQGKPFCIVMPPPNANGELHLGHATFVAVSDALIRYHRMMGSPTLWLPGVDHAGILTQVTFERKLQKEEEKTRYDLGREEFYKRCYEFCLVNKSLMEDQLKRLGASCDWSREKFTLDPEISRLVYETFIRMHNEGLVYRGYRIVNWCPRCRSTLADVELEWEEREDKLYFVKYPWGEKFVTVATTRVEPIWLDTHLAVNPKDKKNSDLIGQKVKNPLTNVDMEIIGDEFVDPDFGTGVVKLTPAHDTADYEIAVKHNLPIKNGVDFDGRLTAEAGEWAGLKTKEAREKIAEYLERKGAMEKVIPYQHEVATCERCGAVIEPLVSRQWFVKIKSLAEAAIKATEEGKVKIVPKKYEKMYFNWMRNIRDWPISRQLWWGHRLPVWYRREDQKSEEQKKEFELLKKGDARARTDALESPILAVERPSEPGDWIQDPDTFDTWFSSGQWPFTTLASSSDSKLKMQNLKWIDENPNSDFSRFYPTSVMNTAYEILFLWVARMIMFGLYLTGKVPFETALINGVLRDEKGQKMSKSKGNGVNPNEAIEKYGADAVRMALVAGRDNGNDLLISKKQMEERIRGYRNFSNKIWNIARFVENVNVDPTSPKAALGASDEWILEELKKLVESVTGHIERYRLGQAAEEIYEFTWHKLADVYVERFKNSKTQSFQILKHVLTTCLKLLHPFMPFVTEAIYQELRKPSFAEVSQDPMLITSSWPRPEV